MKQRFYYGRNCMMFVLFHITANFNVHCPFLFFKLDIASKSILFKHLHSLAAQLALSIHRTLR